MIRFLTTMLLAIMVTPTHADWTGVGEAGVVIATGNTETTTGNGKLDFALEVNKWKHQAGVSGLYASTDGDKTAQRWQVVAQSDYNFGPKTFAFGAGSYEQDEFSGFSYRATVSGGVGRHFIDTERTKLTASAGVGYKFFETEDALDALGNVTVPGEQDDELIFRGTADFSRELTETTSVTDAFITEAGSTNTFMENNLALKVKMNSKLALSIAFVIRHNTDPPAGFKSTDKLTTINLVYEIK